MIARFDPGPWTRKIRGPPRFADRESARSGRASSVAGTGPSAPRPSCSVMLVAHGKRRGRDSLAGMGLLRADINPRTATGLRPVLMEPRRTPSRFAREPGPLRDVRRAVARARRRRDDPAGGPRPPG